MPAQVLLGRCNSCSKSWNYDFRRDGPGVIRRFAPPDGKYFLISNSTGFELELLHDFWVQLSTGNKSTIENLAECYNCRWDAVADDMWASYAPFAPNKARPIPGVATSAAVSWSLNSDQLLKALLLWRLFYIHKDDSNLQDIDFGDRNVDQLVSAQLQRQRPEGGNEFSRKWLPHKCSKQDDNSCHARCIMVDGNAKCVHCVCAFDGCHDLPLRGNQHQAPSQFCARHALYQQLQDAVYDHARRQGVLIQTIAEDGHSRWEKDSMSETAATAYKVSSLPLLL